LARIAKERHVGFVAVELHEHRASLMRRVLPDSVTVHVGDARSRPWGNQFFDRVLLDAPCSGLGALRRRPEARWRRSEADLAVLQNLQIELLDSAVGATRSGGVIGYATCSPVLEETREVVDEVLARRGDVVIEDARALFPPDMDLGDGPWVQLWPHIHGTDAMFFALLRRK
jgi:16S rRNA (cytosine967-C5)-methyltransferase